MCAVHSTNYNAEGHHCGIKITGQYDPLAGGCDIDCILGQCKEPFTAHEVQQVKNALSQLSALMKENGELKEVDYEVLGFDQGGALSQRQRQPCPQPPAICYPHEPSPNCQRRRETHSQDHCH
jgi:hypothetical protein